MNLKQQTIFDQIKLLLQQNYEVEEALIFWEADVCKTIGLTLPQYAELTIDLQHLFDVKVSDVSALNMTTVGQLVNFIIVKKQMAD